MTSQSNRNGGTADSRNSLFHPVENTILSEWLGINPPQGCPAYDDLEALPYDENTVDHVTLRHDYTGFEESEHALSDAVARIALKPIERRLPQFVVFDQEGTVTEYGRHYSDLAKHDTRSVVLLPRLAFAINWADSAPGISWPESYYVTYIPGYDLYIVTGSNDTPEIYGYCDRAIGHFPASKEVVKGIRELLMEDWAKMLHGYDQGCWEQFLDEGIIRETQAINWRNRVWSGQYNYFYAGR